MSSITFIPPHVIRERLAAQPPPITYLAPSIPRAPLVWGTAADLLAALGTTLVLLTILALLWAPIILAAAWAFRRLHFH